MFLNLRSRRFVFVLHLFFAIVLLNSQSSASDSSDHAHNGSARAGIFSGQLSVNPSNIVFHGVPIGQNDQQTITLTNSGHATVAIHSVTVSGNAFRLQGTVPKMLAAGEHALVTVVFSPMGEGNFQGAVTIASDSPDSPRQLLLIGNDPNSIPQDFFGLQMNSGVVGEQPWPVASFSGTRLWDSNTHWEDVNTHDGYYNWEILDKWLAHAQRYNVDVLYTFGDVPTWASSNPNDHSCAGGPGSCDPPNDLNPDGSGSNQHWKDYVSAIVTHSQNSSTAHITYWELWNEPYHPLAWKGTIAQLIRMASDARDIIKAVDPSAVLLTPPAVFCDQGTAWLHNYLAAGGAQYADLIAFHGYVQHPPATPVPEDLVSWVDTIKNILAQYGLQDRTLWDTEASWGYTKPTGFTDADMQAAFVTRFYLLHWSVGVPRFYWYQWNAGNTVGTLWVPNGGSGTVLKPGIAYQQVYDWMVGATLSAPCSASGWVWTCQFTRPNGYQALAVWDASESCHKGICGTKPYAYDSIYTQYKDVAGHTNYLKGSTVPIGAQPILLENQ